MFCTLDQYIEPVGEDAKDLFALAVVHTYIFSVIVFRYCHMLYFPHFSVCTIMLGKIVECGRGLVFSIENVRKGLAS